jgi:hypothetical protein
MEPSPFFKDPGLGVGRLKSVLTDVSAVMRVHTVPLSKLTEAQARLSRSCWLASAGPRDPGYRQAVPRGV